MSEKQIKGITCCGDCGMYDWKKHRCSLHCKEEGKPQSNFYADCPLPDVAPVVHGRWESVCGCIVRCNSCGSEAARKSNYCPNCGARMDVKEDKQ